MKLLTTIIREKLLAQWPRATAMQTDEAPRAGHRP